MLSSDALFAVNPNNILKKTIQFPVIGRFNAHAT